MSETEGVWRNRDPIWMAGYLERTAADAYLAFWRVARCAGRLSCDVEQHPGGRTVSEAFHPIVVKESAPTADNPDRTVTRVYLLGEVREVPNDPNRPNGDAPIVARQTVEVRERVFGHDFIPDGEEFVERTFDGLPLCTRRPPGSTELHLELSGGIREWLDAPEEIFVEQARMLAELQTLEAKINAA